MPFKKDRTALQESFDTKCSAKLVSILSKSMKIRRLSIEDWSHEFRLLRKLQDNDDIWNMLTWFESHFRDAYVPQIQSARSFRLKFGKLIESAKRQGGVPHPDIVISVEAQRIINWHSDSNWPGRESSQLPAFIQLSIDNMNKFRTAMRTLYCQLKLEADQIQNEQRRKGKPLSTKTTRDQNLVAHLIGSLAGNDMLIRDMVERLQNYAWKNPNWSGNLINCVWKCDDEFFQKTMMRFTAEYMGDGKHWFPIWEKLQPFLKGDKNENLHS